ncbi:hypothetical protein GW17_00002882 [Ensete ventricosum]|nr:hypothetical protein GW17_00002882 [Ensete ventricosum]
MHIVVRLPAEEVPSPFGSSSNKIHYKSSYYPASLSSNNPICGTYLVRMETITAETCLLIQMSGDQELQRHELLQHSNA